MPMPDDLSPRNMPHGPERVTFHAVKRYVQRVLKIEISEAFVDAANEAAAYAQAAGLTIEQVRAVIWTSGVAFASLHGCTTVRTADFVATLAPKTGAVVTLVSIEGRCRKKMKQRSKREMRAMIQSHHRRQRRIKNPIIHDDQKGTEQ